MHIEQKTGTVPGIIFATVRHGPTVRTLPVLVMRNTSGHYVSKLPSGRWSVECQSEDNAILIHAALVFPVEIEGSPWLANPPRRRVFAEVYYTQSSQSTASTSEPAWVSSRQAAFQTA